MSNIKETLKQSIELEKKAHFDYLTNLSASAIAGLVRGGVEFEKAASLVKQACDENSRAREMLEKAAVLDEALTVITDLEDKLEKKAEVVAKIETSKEPLDKLAELGYSKEDLEAFASLPNDLIEKVASSAGQPSGMGSGVGIPMEKTDPLLQFLLGSN